MLIDVEVAVVLNDYQTAFLRECPGSAPRRPRRTHGSTLAHRSASGVGHAPQDGVE